MHIRKQIKNALLKSYSYVSVFEAMENKQYWLTFKTMFREQAARVFQRNFRRKKALPAPTNYTETLSDTAKLIRFIKEPIGNDHKMFEHIQRITQGDWLKVDYKDAEFERTIYRAFRLNHITRDDLATSLMLYQAQIEFGNPIKRHTFTEPGPFAFNSISYATEEALQDFHQRLNALPETQQCYFSVNFSPLNTALFLYDGILTNYTTNNFRAILNVYFSQLASTDPQIKAALHNILHPDLGEQARQLLANKIREVYHDYEIHLGYSVQKAEGNYWYRRSYSIYFDDSVRDSQHNISQYLLTGVNGTDTAAPGVTISPDFDINNLRSPFLCMMIFTLPALRALLDMHGEEHVTYPFIIAGQVSTRLMRKLDEQPHEFGSAKPLRPIEIHHPDLLQNPNPHGCRKVYPFALTWHDITHLWQNSIITSKKFVRHARSLLSSVTGYEMSKAIWHLTDMDMAYYHNVRNHLKQNRSFVNLSEVISLSILLSNICNNIWKQTDAHDINLLFVTDMIINNYSWTFEFLPNINPELAFKMDEPDKWQGVTYNFNLNFEAGFFNKDLLPFQTTFSSMLNLIASHPIILTEEQRNTSNPTTFVAVFFILAYRLQNHPDGIALCKQLYEKDLKNFLAWNKNGGLRLKSQGATIEDMPVNDLYSQLDNDLKCFLFPQNTEIKRCFR